MFKASFDTLAEVYCLYKLILLFTVTADVSLEFIFFQNSTVDLFSLFVPLVNRKRGYFFHLSCRGQFRGLESAL